MTKRQKIRRAVFEAKRDNVLGAGRTAALELIRARYMLGSAGNLRALCVHGSPALDYWN